MDYQIEKNIPISTKRADIVKYPFSQMEVGDSFTVPIEERHKIAQSAFYFGKKNGKKFATRREIDKIRVWRVR